MGRKWQITALRATGRDSFELVWRPSQVRYSEFLLLVFENNYVCILWYSLGYVACLLWICSTEQKAMF